jgi:hypothetical protein
MFSTVGMLEIPAIKMVIFLGKRCRHSNHGDSPILMVYVMAIPGIDNWFVMVCVLWPKKLMVESSMLSVLQKAAWFVLDLRSSQLVQFSYAIVKVHWIRLRHK